MPKLKKRRGTLSHAARERLLRAILKSPTYARAYQDTKFLAREELRPIRLELELLKPEMQLTELDIRSTIIVFGSARIKSASDARKNIRGLTDLLRKSPSSRSLRLKLAAAKGLLERAVYHDEARKFAALVTRSCQGDSLRDYVIVTGGGPGIMEAANRGAYEAGGKSIGLNITLPHEQVPNPYITPELCFRFHYFALRKMHFLMRAKAMVAFPGGFGTFDELFETLTLVQTSKKHPFPILLFGKEFWTSAIDFDYLAAQGVISHHDLNLIQFVETAEEAWAAIRRYWHRPGMTPPRRRRSLAVAHLEDPPLA